MAGFPTYEGCQPAEGEEPDPEKVFQWVFVALPFTSSTPLLIQPQVRPMWSELFWNLGFRHHPELQTVKIRHPRRGQLHALNGSTSVVPIDDPEPDPITIPDPLAYSPHEQAVMAERLYHSGALRDAIPAGLPQLASVDTGEQFDPRGYSVATVNGYLMAASPAERRRVIAAEMTGKARVSILRKWPGV